MGHTRDDGVDPVGSEGVTVDVSSLRSFAAHLDEKPPLGEGLGEFGDGTVLVGGEGGVAAGRLLGERESAAAWGLADLTAAGDREWQKLATATRAIADEYETVDAYNAAVLSDVERHIRAAERAEVDGDPR